MPFINVIIMNISKDKIHMSEDTGYSSNTSKCVLDQLTLQLRVMFFFYECLFVVNVFTFFLLMLTCGKEFEV